MIPLFSGNVVLQISGIEAMVKEADEDGIKW